MADVTRGNVLWHGAHFVGLLDGTVSRGDPVGHNGTGWVRADANGVISCKGFALADGDSGDFINITTDCVQQTSTDLTTGNMLWLSETVGRIADADPAAVASQTQVIGWVVRGAGTELMYLSANIPHITIRHTIAGTAAATATNYGVFHIVDRQMRLLNARERHRTAGNDAGAVTLQIEKLPSGTAEGSGTNMLTTTFNLKSTADTPVLVAATSTAANARVVPGEALALVDSGTLTAVADMTVTLTFIPHER